MTPGGTLQPPALAGTRTPEALLLSGFDPETVYLKNVRTAGVCGLEGRRWRRHFFILLFLSSFVISRNTESTVPKKSLLSPTSPTKAAHRVYVFGWEGGCHPFRKIAHSGPLDDPGGGSVVPAPLYFDRLLCMSNGRVLQHNIMFFTDFFDYPLNGVYIYSV